MEKAYVVILLIIVAAFAVNTLNNRDSAYDFQRAIERDGGQATGFVTRETTQQVNSNSLLSLLQSIGVPSYALHFANALGKAHGSKTVSGRLSGKSVYTKTTHENLLIKAFTQKTKSQSKGEQKFIAALSNKHNSFTKLLRR